MKSSRNPHERGGNLPKNVGIKPPPERRIAASKQMSTTAGQGRGGTTGPGTPSPKLSGAQSVSRGSGTRVGQAPGGASQQASANRIGDMGYGSGRVAKKGGTTKTRKVTGPKFGRGPGGIGRTGRGAPWG